MIQFILEYTVLSKHIEGMSQSPKVPVCIGLAPDLLSRLDGVAASASVTRSWLVSRVLEGWLANLDAAALANDLPLATVANAAIAESLELAQ